MKHLHFVKEITFLDAINFINEKKSEKYFILNRQNSIFKDNYEYSIVIYFFNGQTLIKPLEYEISSEKIYYLFEDKFTRDDIEMYDLLITRQGDEFLVIPSINNKWDVKPLKFANKEYNPCFHCWDKNLDYGANKQYNIKEIYRNGKLVYKETLD